MAARLVVAGLMMVLVTLGAPSARAQQPDTTSVLLKQLSTRVIDTDPAAQQAAREAVRIDTRNRLRAADARETAAWRQLQSRADWERFRDERLAKLRASLGVSLAPLEKLDVQVTREFAGPGCRIRNLYFTSRSGFVVAANLYLPAQPVAAMPGILISHSHHAPKHQGELQTMGVTWARSGAAVLVMDQFGHGERRLHRFDRSDAWPGSFRPERQDYYFRFNSSLLLQFAGRSLMGVMVADLMTGVDVLLQQESIDRQRMMILGAVAGGGDPAGVTAALDPRITCAVPFNFGGYEPEDQFPLPENAEETFDFAGSGSWESTRNLAYSARDGFMPWVIVGSLAPRHLIYAHEFRWDEPRDPVWKRLRQIYAWYQADDHLASVVGRGTVKGRAPEASHCTNIGALHRSQIYPAFQRWFEMPIPVEPDFERFTAEQLRCFPDTWTRDEYVARTMQSLAESLRFRSEPLNLAGQLTMMLGELKPEPPTTAVSLGVAEQQGIHVERIRLDLPGQDVRIPLTLAVLRKPMSAPVQRVVVGIAQRGKQAFLEQRSEEIAAVLERGGVVVLADLRGMGESEPAGEGRGRASGSTSRAASELMLGRTTLGLRIRDLRTVLAYLRECASLRGAEFSLWGEGLVAANDTQDLAAPLDAERLPLIAEPAGALIVAFTSWLEPEIRTAVVRGGVYELPRSPYLYLPYDCAFFLTHQLRFPAETTRFPQPTPNPSRWLGERLLHVDGRDAQNRSIQVPQPLRSGEPSQIVDWLLQGLERR